MGPRTRSEQADSAIGGVAVCPTTTLTGGDGAQRKERSGSAAGAAYRARCSDTPPDPGDVGFLGAAAVVVGANPHTHAVEKPRRRLPQQVGALALAVRETGPVGAPGCRDDLIDCGATMGGPLAVASGL
jgi:hypothetical protein